LQAEENGIGAEFGAEAAIAELVVGLAGEFFAGRIAELGFFFAAAFENAENVAGLGNFPAIERGEFGEDAFAARFFGCWWRKRFEGLREAVAIVALAEARVFVRNAAVVIERSAPEKAGVGHHVGGDGTGFVGMAAHGAAGFGSDAEIAGIDEFDVFGRFAEPFCEESLRDGGAIF